MHVVVAKSPHCEPLRFASAGWCAKLINADAPRTTSTRLHSLGHILCIKRLFRLTNSIKSIRPRTFFEVRHHADFQPLTPSNSGMIFDSTSVTASGFHYVGARGLFSRLHRRLANHFQVTAATLQPG